MRSILLCNSPRDCDRVYAPQTLAALAEEAGLEPRCYTKSDILSTPDAFSDVQYLFTTWGMPALTEEEIRRCFPNVSALFYAAGSVQAFARPFLHCGVKVFSAWTANAVPVAEYTTAQIVLANKGFFQASAAMSVGDTARAYRCRDSYPGNFGESVGIIGAGMIGKLVIRLLKHYNLRVLVFDPFLPEDTARELGVEMCTLEELFSRCQVISNHLANNAQTKGMLDGHLFRSMRPYATFLNTGRGAQVVEADLAQTLAQRPDLTAVLDVTFPEPPEQGHPFYSLPNCILTPHIAGSSGNEVHRMSEYMLAEFRALQQGLPCRCEVTEQMLQTMA